MVMSSGPQFYSNSRWHKEKNCYFQQRTGACLKEADSEALAEALQKGDHKIKTLHWLKSNQDICQHKRKKTLCPGSFFDISK